MIGRTVEGKGRIDVLYNNARHPDGRTPIGEVETSSSTRQWP
jgi:hypothetical protein